jgi:hypothetical protein
MDKVKFDTLQKDITLICDYLEVDEKKHYEESGRPKDHIWCYVKRTKQWLKNNGRFYFSSP